MKTKIAVATVHGRAYYKLVTELQWRHLPFLSLKPWDSVPMSIKVVLPACLGPTIKLISFFGTCDLGSSKSFLLIILLF